MKTLLFHDSSLTPVTYRELNIIVCYFVFRKLNVPGDGLLFQPNRPAISSIWKSKRRELKIPRVKKYNLRTVYGPQIKLPESASRPHRRCALSFPGKIEDIRKRTRRSITENRSETTCCIFSFYEQTHFETVFSPRRYIYSVT